MILHRCGMEGGGGLGFRLWWWLGCRGGGEGSAEVQVSLYRFTMQSTVEPLITDHPANSLRSCFLKPFLFPSMQMYEPLIRDNTSFGNTLVALVLCHNVSPVNIPIYIIYIYIYPYILYSYVYRRHCDIYTYAMVSIIPWFQQWLYAAVLLSYPHNV